MRNTDRVYIYPEYIMKELTRSEGRRIASKYSIEDPKLLEIKLAAQSIGFKDVEVNKNASYPRQWYYNRGVVYIKRNEEIKDITKQKLIKKIAIEIEEKIRPMIKKKRDELQKQKKGKTRTKVKSGTLDRGKRKKGIRRR